ncbi:TetR family transcriptional regulator [Lentzea pudingi]|uniref:TetR family transcriptional regulator n=1 Tax=Lentzea pudingi TaxID=1789439 RepID=A0ABQ2HAT3_9PSEU|nr:TetR family transcriptional regulator [Lentzea pudingi]
MLKHVITVLTERGYGRTRFSDVAQVAGLAVSTLQFYFGSRDDMLLEALQHSTEQEVLALEATAAEGSPWQRLVALVDRALDPLSEDAWRMLMEFWHASMRDPELREHGEHLHRRYRQPFVDAIRGGVEQGDFQGLASSDEAIENVVTVLVGVLDGLIIPRVLDHEYYDGPGVRTVVLATLASALGVTPTDETA